MTNAELNNFRPLPISDTHIHYLYAKPLEESLGIFKTFIEYFGMKSITLLSIAQGSGHRGFDPTCNVKGLYLKSRINGDGAARAYVYGSPIHFYDERDTAEGYLSQVEKMYELGVDGYKLLDGKPAMRKALGKPLCDPVFEGMYEFIEQKGMPLKIHMNDPRKYWGPKELLTPGQIARGWWCGDGTYPAFDEVYGELEAILARHPKLKLCIAHMGYLTDDYPHAVRLLEQFENLTFDLTPGASTFKSFTDNPELWSEFLERYSHRIFLGSDTYNLIEDTEENVARGIFERSGGRITLVRRMLEHRAEDSFEYAPFGTLRPINLPDGVLKNIYTENALRLHGEGRIINRSAAIREAERLHYELSRGAYPEFNPEELPLELSNLELIIKHFS